MRCFSVVLACVFFAAGVSAQEKRPAGVDATGQKSQPFGSVIFAACGSSPSWRLARQEQSGKSVPCPA